MPESKVNMTANRTGKVAKLLAAVLAVGLPAGLAHAQSSYRYDDATVQSSSRVDPQDALRRDQADLDATRRQYDDLTARRDEQQRLVDSLKRQLDGGPADQTAPAAGNLDQALADQARLRDQVKAAQQQFDDAKAKADKLHADALAKFEQTPEWKDAFARFNQARTDLKGPTDAVLQQMAQTRECQDLIDAARAAKEKADRLHEDKTADPKAVRDAEDAFIAADNKVHDCQERALTADAKVVAGRKAVDEANDRLREQRDRFEQDLIHDPAFGPAVDDVRAKREAFDQANADLKRADDRVAALQGNPAGNPVPAAVAATPEALRDAQAKLDQLNRDREFARQDIDKLADRVRDDQDAAGTARSTPAPYDDRAYNGGGYGGGYNGGYAPAPPPSDAGATDYPPAYEPAYQPAYEPAPAYSTTYVYNYPYTYYGYGADYYCYPAYYGSGLYLGLSFGYGNRFCDDWYSRWCGPRYGYRDYYRGYYGRDYYGGRGYGHYGYYDGYRGGRDYGRDYVRRDYGRDYGSRDYGRSYARDYGGSYGRDYSSSRNYSRDYARSGSYGSPRESSRGGTYGYAGSAYRDQAIGRDRSSAYESRGERRSFDLGSSSSGRSRSYGSAAPEYRSSRSYSSAPSFSRSSPRLFDLSSEYHRSSSSSSRSFGSSGGGSSHHSESFSHSSSSGSSHDSSSSRGGGRSR